MPSYCYCHFATFFIDNEEISKCFIKLLIFMNDLLVILTLSDVRCACFCPLPFQKQKKKKTRHSSTFTIFGWYELYLFFFASFFFCFIFINRKAKKKHRRNSAKNKRCTISDAIEQLFNTGSPYRCVSHSVSLARSP